MASLFHLIPHLIARKNARLFKLYAYKAPSNKSRRVLGYNPKIKLKHGLVELHFTGGINGGRGWKVDVKNMFLNIDKLQKRGWKPRYKSSDSIRLTIKAEMSLNKAKK